jgi:hypothetical protein
VVISAEELQLADRLEGIFMPYAAGRRRSAIEKNTRFVHYTSAAAALNIISTKSIWMLSTTCMSDYREVQHGFDTMNRFFQNEPDKEAFFNALNGCAPNLGNEAVTLFNQWWQNIQLQTYISSMSEHDDSEDLHGRLSMWRAFARAASRVALILRLPMNSGATVPLNIFFSPVAYLTDVQVRDELRGVTTSIQSNLEFLRTLDRQRLIGLIFNMLMTAVVSLKHEGFHEEREWRVIYSPKRTPSTLITSDIQVIEGVPQLIYKIPLDAAASSDLALLDIANIFDRLIIGPSQFSWAMYETFVAVLTNAGVTDASTRVFMSGIPIRT